MIYLGRLLKLNFADQIIFIFYMGVQLPKGCLYFKVYISWQITRTWKDNIAYRTKWICWLIYIRDHVESCCPTTILLTKFCFLNSWRGILIFPMSYFSIKFFDMFYNRSMKFCNAVISLPHDDISFLLFIVCSSLFCSNNGIISLKAFINGVHSILVIGYKFPIIHWLISIERYQ